MNQREGVNQLSTVTYKNRFTGLRQTVFVHFLHQFVLLQGVPFQPESYSVANETVRLYKSRNLELKQSLYIDTQLM